LIDGQTDDGWMDGWMDGGREGGRDSSIGRWEIQPLTGNARNSTDLLLVLLLLLLLLLLL
jgi:hypothetical protein